MRKIIIIKNIGIYAHVDAGKTTITEHLLYNTGVIRAVGRVDSGNTQTDSMELERKRGISIQSAPVSFMLNNTKVNLIDTPGHSDFVAEVERSMNVLDGAILVISAREGVQSHTSLLFDALARMKIPTILFINKIDRIGVSISAVLKDIDTNLTKKALPIQRADIDLNQNCIVDKIFEYEKDAVLEFLADYDDTILSNLVNGADTSKNYLNSRIIELAKHSEIYPILFGSALHSIGVEELITGIELLLPHSKTRESEVASGIVFKIKRNKNNERKIYVRLYEGRLNVRDYLNGEKITRIERLFDGKEKPDSNIESGDIGIIYGADNLKVGDCFGDVQDKLQANLGTPTVKVEISPANQNDRLALLNALTIISEEDPFLGYEISEIEKSIFLSIFGEIQMEIIQYRLQSEYGIEVLFKDAITIYKETPIGVGRAVMRKYAKGNPFYATVGLKVEPAPVGTGIEYVSKVPTGHLPQGFQNGIVDGINYAVTQGLQGWELNDIKITLIEGNYCSVNSTPADFRNLTPMVLLEAVDQAKTKLQWPLFAFKLKVPSYAIGKALSDLARMKAGFDSPVLSDNSYNIEGRIPADLCRKYDLEVRSYTEGKGIFITQFYRYEAAPAEIEATREKTKVDPLNKNMYILFKRRAFK